MKQYKRKDWKRFFTIMTVLVLVFTSIDVTAFASRVPAQEQNSEGGYEYTAEQPVAEEYAGMGYAEQFLAEPVAQASGSVQPDTCSSIAGDNLTGRAKKLYDEFKPKIKKVAQDGGKTDINLDSYIYYLPTDEQDTIFREDLKKLLNALLADCPYEMYWYSLGTPIYCTKVVNRNGLMVVFDLDYKVVLKYAKGNSIYNQNILDSSNLWKQKNAIKNAQPIIDQNKNYSFLNRIQEYNTAINNRVKYEESSSKELNDGILDVFDYSSSTNTGALGYARAFQYLCNIDGGITSYTVTGDIKGYIDDDTTAAIEREHAWNIVSVNGVNYLVDVCNCGYDIQGEAVWGAPNVLVMKGVKEITQGEEYEAEFEKDGKTYRMVYTYDADTLSTFTKEQLTLTSESYPETVITDESVSITDSDVTTYDREKVHNVEVRDSEGSIMPTDSYNLVITKDGISVDKIRNAGNYEILVTGKEGYSSGSVKKEFTVNKKVITPTITGSTTKVYDGTTKVTDKGLSISLDGVCQYDTVGATATYTYDNPDAGEGKLITASDIVLMYSAAENYVLSITNPTIDTGIISKAEPDIEFVVGSGSDTYSPSYEYTGGEISNPRESQLKLRGVEYDNLVFTWYEGSSAQGKLMDNNPVYPGTYYLTISVAETKNYVAKTIGNRIKVNRRFIWDPIIEISQDSYQYDGSEKTPEVTVKYGNVTLPEDEYTVSYSDNIEAGQATVNIRANDGGNYYMRDQSKNFTITPFDITGLSVTVAEEEDLTYTGTAIRPAAVVKTRFATLVPGKDYTITYTDNTVVGMAAFSVKGQGNYTGQTSGTFGITVGEFTREELYNGKKKNALLYYSKAVSITAQDTEAGKYSISDSLDIDSFSKEYTFKSEKDGKLTKKLYFRNIDTGRIYQKDITVNFDNTAPTGKIKVDAKLWDRFLEIISFGHYKAAAKTVTIEAADTSSGISTIEYLISNKPLTLDELKDTAVNYIIYDKDNKPVLKENENQVVYVKLTDNAGNTAYLSSDGVVLDTTAPVISGIQIVTGEEWTDTQFKFEFTVNEEGIYYYTVLPAAAAAPDVKAVMSAATAGNDECSGSGTLDTLTGGRAVINRTVTGLTANTEYKIYIVAQDKVYNISTNESEPNTSAVVTSDVVKTKKAAPVVEETPTVSGVYGTKLKELSVTGGKVTAGGVKIDGSWKVAVSPDAASDKLLSVGTMEKCTLLFTPDDTDYPVSEVEVTPVITARPVKITINPASRAYKSDNPEFTYKLVEEAGFEQVVEGDELGIVLTTTADISSGVGNYDVMGTAVNTNYAVTITGGKNALTITKAKAIQAVTDVTQSYVYTSGSKGRIEIIDLSKEMNFPDDCTDAVCQLTTKDDDKLLKSVQISGTTLQYSVNAADKECIGKTALLKVTIQMANYEDTTYELTIQITEQKDVAGYVSECEMLMYGQKLGDSKLTGTFTDKNNTDKSLEGTIRWKNTDEQPLTGTTEAEWIFIPADSDYKSLSGKAKLIIKKATPKITAIPKVSEMEYNPDKKLDDIELNGGKAVNPFTNEELTKGMWSWENSDIVPTVGNEGYKLIFTPADVENYNTAEVIVRIPMKKATPLIITVPAAKELTYGQTLSDSTLMGGEVSTAGSFGWVKVDARPGVKDSNITEYEVVFTPEDSINWEKVSVKMRVKVSPKTLNWDYSSLIALNKMQDGSKEAKLTGEVKVSGMLDGENPELGDVKLAAEFDTSDAGVDKKVTINVVEATLRNENYKLPEDNILVLSGTIERTNNVAVQPGLGKEYRLVMGEKDVAEVTADLVSVKKADVLLNTPDNIIKYLKKLLIERKDGEKLPAKENAAVYEVLLLYSPDNISWTRVTADNFPAQGVKVTLPYPQGTNGEDYQFSAVHMFTENRTDASGKAYLAGDVETPALTLTQDGITMTLSSLSPVALSWVKLDNSSGEAGQIDGDIGDTASTVVQSTDTGDNSRPILWSIFAIIGMLGICLVITFGRKRNKDI